MNFGIIFNKKGQIAILTVLLLLAVILAVSVGLITMTLREMKMARNVTESVRAFAAADAGMEYILKERANDDTPSDNLCTDSPITWKEVLDESGQESYYCVGSVVLTEDEEGYYSIGRSGDTRRAIFAPAPGSLDQSSKNLGNNQGHQVCSCTPAGNPGASLINFGQQAAQTFIAGRDGTLFAASAYLLINPIGQAENINLRAEIRDVDALYIDNFYPTAAKPGTTVLASTTDFTQGEIWNEKCVPPNNCRYITFNFDPPATTTEGERYTFLIEGGGAPLLTALQWILCCGERRYLPGKGWLRDNPAFPWNDTFGPQNHRFDYDFKVYILTDPTGEFEESFP